MKLSELIRDNADNYIQVKGVLDEGVASDGRRFCCVLGMLGWVLFPGEMEGVYIQIPMVNTQGGLSATCEDSDSLHMRVLNTAEVTYDRIKACFPGYDSLITANDLGLSFEVIADKLESCGL